MTPRFREFLAGIAEDPAWEYDDDDGGCNISEDARAVLERWDRMTAALEQTVDAVDYMNNRCRPDMPGTMLQGLSRLFEAKHSAQQALGQGEEE